MLTLGTGVTIFLNYNSAKRALSHHLTSYLGRSAKKFTFTDQERNIIKWKSHEGDNIALKWGHSSRPSIASYNEVHGFDHSYDSNFDKKAFREICKKSREEEIGYRAEWDQNSNYFKALKMVFGDGPSLRDFLLENKIATIEPI